jgi:heme-degrading monooxygenase HmoA
MTTIGMRYQVRPGKEQEFEKGFLSTLELLKTLPGHIESHLYEDVAETGSYIILSRWASKEAYAAFLQSDAFKAAVAWGKAEILRARPSHRVYRDDDGAAPTGGHGGAGNAGGGGRAGGPPEGGQPSRPTHSA